MTTLITLVSSFSNILQHPSPLTSIPAITTILPLMLPPSARVSDSHILLQPLTVLWHPLCLVNQLQGGAQLKES